MSKVVVMDHPLIEQKIGIIRRKETGTKDFRQNISEIAMLIGYEATKDLKLEEVEIETPICKTTVKQLKGKKTGTGTHPARRPWYGRRNAVPDPGCKGRTYRTVP